MVIICYSCQVNSRFRHILTNFLIISWLKANIPSFSIPSLIMLSFFMFVQTEGIGFFVLLGLKSFSNLPLPYTIMNTLHSEFLFVEIIPWGPNQLPWHFYRSFLTCPQTPEISSKWLDFFIIDSSQNLLST